MQMCFNYNVQILLQEMCIFLNFIIKRSYIIYRLFHATTTPVYALSIDKTGMGQHIVSPHEMAVIVLVRFLNVRNH